MSMMRYKFDKTAAYGLEAGVVGTLLATTKTSDAIDMNLDSGTLVADWVGARVSFIVTPGGNTDDTLRCAILFSGDGTNYDVAPTGVLFLGAMGVGDVPHPAELGASVLDHLIVDSGAAAIEAADGDQLWAAPASKIWNFRIVNRHAAVTNVNFCVQVVPAAVAMKIHLYKSSGETGSNDFTLSSVSIQRFRQAIGDF
jgi:hypothetical protein